MSHRNTHAALRGARWRLPRSRSSSASTPTFWQVSTRADLLKGDVENLSIDNDGRLSLGPPTVARLRFGGAVPVDRRPRGRRLALHRQRQRGQGVPRRAPTARRRPSTTRPNSRSTRWRPRRTAGSTSPRRPTARSTRSTRTAAATPFFKPEDEVHLVAGRGRGRQRLRRNRREGRHLQDRAGRQGQRLLQDHGPPTSSRSRSTRRATCWPAPSRRAGSSGSTARGRRSCSSSRRSARSTRCGVDDKGVIYATAVAAQAGGTGAPTSARPRHRRREPARAAPVPSVSAEITGFTIIDVGGAGHAEAKAGAAEGRVPRLEGRDLPHPARRPLGHGLGIVRRHAVRRGPVGRRQPARRHRQQGQDLPRRRRSAAGHAGRPRARAAGHALPDDVRRATCYYVTSNPGKLFRLVPGTRGARHLRVGRARHADRVDVGHDQLEGHRRRRARRSNCRTRSGNSQTPDDTWSPWSEPYRNPDGQQIQSPKARYLQWQATLIGKDDVAGADVGDGGVPPAQPAPAGDVDHGLPRRPRVPEALFDRRGRDCRLRRGLAGHQAVADGPAPPARRATPASARARSAAGSTRRDCRRSPGRPRTTTTTSCSTTCSTGGRARPTGRR